MSRSQASAVALMVSMVVACSSPRAPWARGAGDGGAGPGAGGAGTAETAGAPASARVAPLTDPALNLSFEDGDPPTGWVIKGPHTAAVADASVSHVGARSLRIDAAGEGRSFTALSKLLPIDTVRGKRVRVSAWLRAAKLDGELGIWLRADGANATRPLAFGGSHARPVTGDSDWVRRESAVEVPAAASAFVFGAFVSGSGQAWIDHVEVAIEDLHPPAPIAITGTVRDAVGAPVVGALVAASTPADYFPTRVVTTDAGGRFTLELMSGRWAFTATSPRGAGAYAEMRELTAPVALDLQLGDGGITIRGDVQLQGPPPPHLRLIAIRTSQVEGDLFPVDVEADGRFAVRVPVASGYTLMLAGDGVMSDPAWVAGDVDRTATLAATIDAPAPGEVVPWLASRAAPLATAAPGGGTDDLRSLHELVAGARVIALGEATHGTREFFQLKHRVLEYLVEHEGVRWFAIEANQPEARKVDDYVLTGAGTAADALAGLYFWTWNTEEVLAMIEWMRDYNADPRHADKVRFAGFDMQVTKVAWPAVTAYLARVDPTYAATVSVRLAAFAEDGLGSRWPSLPADERAALRADLAAVVARFDRERARWSKQAGADAWAIARQDARVVEQAAAMYDAGDSGFEARDRAMAENVDWLLARAGAGARIMLWAHNGHIARVNSGPASMGSFLTSRHGDAYRPIGFVFADGGFQAIGPAGEGLAAFEVGPPGATDVSQPFLKAGLERALLDLRAPPAGAIADWLAAPHPTRESGALYADEKTMTRPLRLATRFDAVMFVAHTTRARPNAPRE